MLSTTARIVIGALIAVIVAGVVKLWKRRERESVRREMVSDCEELLKEIERLEYDRTRYEDDEDVYEREQEIVIMIDDFIETARNIRGTGVLTDIEETLVEDMCYELRVIQNSDGSIDDDVDHAKAGLKAVAHVLQGNVAILPVRMECE